MGRRAFALPDEAGVCARQRRNSRKSRNVTFQMRVGPAHGPAVASPCAVDVSEKETDLPNGLTQHQAMKRFPVRAVDGQLLTGAAAFVVVSSRLQPWDSGAGGAALPAAVAALERGCRLLLPVRPYISRLFGSVHRRLGRADPGPGR